MDTAGVDEAKAAGVDVQLAAEQGDIETLKLVMERRPERLLQDSKWRSTSVALVALTPHSM